MKKTPLKVNPEKVKAWQQRSKKGLKQSGTLARKPIKKIGKVGKANLAANKKIAEQRGDKKRTCLIGALKWPEFTDCLRTWPIQNVHRHKRAWYQGDVELLSSPKQVIDGCQNCHDRIEHDAELTERVFMTLVGPESYEENLQGSDLDNDFFETEDNEVY